MFSCRRGATTSNVVTKFTDWHIISIYFKHKLAQDPPIFKEARPLTLDSLTKSPSGNGSVWPHHGRAVIDRYGAVVVHKRVLSRDLPITPELDLKIGPSDVPRRLSYLVPRSGIVKNVKVKKSYPALRTHGASYRAAQILTRRGSDCLPAAIKFEKSYMEMMKGLRMKRGKCINPDFAEQLYGLPPGWTRTDVAVPPHGVTAECGGKKFVAASLFSGCGLFDLGLF